MIPTECKPLAEVDFPIAEVSRHSAREKSIRHGHPSTLHLWWARRPLAACRAMLLALLLPDPADPHCPEDFKGRARAVLRPPLPQPKGKTDLDLRQALLRFIADFANWDAAAEPVFLEAARSLVKAAHGQEPPLVVDPFAGGGSIPLEALRLGCEAFASDLNPVACLILKVLLEDIPRHGPALADELRRVGAQIKAAAEKELAEFYPADPDGARPIAYLWARTVRCESSGCGAEIPLMRSFWLSKKAKRRRALRYRIERPKGRPPGVVFEVFEPRTDSEVPRSTVSRAKAACPVCGIVLSPERVRFQLSAQRGGADVTFDEHGRRTGGARLLAVVTLQDEERGRRYRLPTEADYMAVWRARRALERRTREAVSSGLSPVPSEPTPAGGGSGAGRAFSVQKYGMFQWGDLFTARQKLALVMLGQKLAAGAEVRSAMALAVSRVAERLSSLARRDNSAKMETIAGTFARQALPVVWDFAEQNPFEEVGGNWEGAVDWIARVGEEWRLSSSGQVGLSDACATPLPVAGASVWFTDPPYYDAVPYADLSDFFFVWLKRSLPDLPLLRDLFDPTNPLTPKSREAVQDETRRVDGQSKDRTFFENTMAQAFAEGRRVLSDDGVGCVVFAHKTTEGWEALLSGMIRGGWVITASWPITTEMGTRLRARDSAALSASVHLVCRPRDEKARSETGATCWGRYRAASRSGWSGSLRRVSGVPIWSSPASGRLWGCSAGMKVLSCPTGKWSAWPPISTPEASRPGEATFPTCGKVVGRTALARVLGTGKPGARNGEAGILEEDARLTALFLWTVQSTSIAENGEDDGDEDDQEPDDEEEASRPARKKGLVLIYDVVRHPSGPVGAANHRDREGHRAPAPGPGTGRPALRGGWRLGCRAAHRVRCETGARAGPGHPFPRPCDSAGSESQGPR
jgi:putative DNA methylase